MTALIDPKKYSETVDLLRSFFLSKNFLEVHTQNRLSILAACEDPETVATYELQWSGMATTTNRSDVVRI